ncbi:MAG: SPOR domain-containing protein [Bacteroidetes bacterium]|nr:MAG: SPOR domain-containing protein [Bacteroidota bacterium]
MPELDDNNLREEEQSGFQPGTPDDESFLLEDKEEYPGELPEGTSTDKSTAEEITSAGETKIGGIKVTEAEQIEVPKEGTVWDLFDSKKPEGEEEVIAGTLPPDEKPIGIIAETEETEESLPAPERIELEKEEEPVSLDKLTSEPEKTITTPASDEGLGEEELPLKSEESSEEPEQIPEEPVKIDEDLAALIQEDLQKAKKRAEKVEAPKEEIQQPIQPTEEEMQQKLEQFKPVEEKGDTDMIDLMKVGAGEPAISEIEDAKAVEEVVEEAPTPPPAEIPPPPVEEKKEVKEEKEKKRIILPWKKIGLSAAAVILLAAIGIGGYYLLWDKIFPAKGKKPEIAEVKQKPKEIKKAVPPKVVPKVDSAVTPTAEVKETKREPDVSVTALDIAEKERKKPKPAIIEKPKPNIVEKSKPVIVEKPKPVVVEKPKPVEEKPKPVIASNEKKPETKATVIPYEKKNVFTVQVYTSPSKDDAEDWMKILRRKNINGFISTQKMRDKVWYRVRFGFYDTREEARAAAEKLGFDQVWIDQIR